jgi:predicted choloylglycine hydrolase
MCLILLSAAAVQPLNNAKSSVDNKKVPVIELKGNGYERGIQHGTILKKEIAELFKKWKNNIAGTTKRNADSVITEFLNATNFEQAIKKFAPEILEEVKGIAEGSKQKHSDVFAFQLVDEFWVFLDSLTYSKNHHCSSFAVQAANGRPAVVAQNLDLPTFYNGYQILLHIARTNTEPEQYIPSVAGLVGGAGLNEKGIGILSNTIMELKACKNGLPVAFVLRGVLSKQNSSDALSFIKTVKHASGQNYILGIRNSVYDFEVSANQVVRFIPKGGNGSLLFHTNHAIANNDVKEWYAEYHNRILGDDAQKMDSGIRYLALEKRLSMPGDEITMDVVKTTLRSTDNARSPVCRPYNEKIGVFTFASIIYSLGNKPSVQITSGPPDKSEYQEYFFNM